MTGFDILVLIVVGVSALLALARGFVRELLSMVALAIAILAVLWGLPIFREPVRQHIEPGWVADTVTVVSLFLLVYIAVRVLTGRIHEWVHDSEPLGILDRTAGILFGVARGFAIMAIGVMIITSIAKEDKIPKFLKDAQFYPFLVITADWLKNFAPSATDKASEIAEGASKSGNEIAKWREGANAITGNEIIAKEILGNQAIANQIGIPKFNLPKDKTTKSESDKDKQRPNSLVIEPEK